MLTILHGDNEVAIHSELTKYIEAAKAKGILVGRLSSKGLNITDLENAIGTQELFASEKLVILEHLFSLPKGKQKDYLINWLASRSLDPVDVVLVEKKALTPTQPKQFPTAKTKMFKLPALVFEWIEQLGRVPKETSVRSFQEILKTKDAEFCFAMLCRQIRLLLQYKSDGVFTGAPFLRGKLSLQAKSFELDQLLSLHSRLLQIDIGQKTSRSSLDLSQEIAILLLEL